MIVLKDGTKHYIGKPFTPDIETVAYSLSHINRYTGHVGGYSVAQHCVHVANVLPEPLKLAGLLHDAPEAYINDVSAPIKQYLRQRTNALDELEDFYHDVIDAHFKVDTRNKQVKGVDMRMLITEAHSFGIYCPEFPPFERYAFNITAWSAEKAERMFIRTFKELTHGKR